MMLKSIHPAFVYNAYALRLVGKLKLITADFVPGVHHGQVSNMSQG